MLQNNSTHTYRLVYPPLAFVVIVGLSLVTTDVLAQQADEQKTNQHQVTVQEQGIEPTQIEDTESDTVDDEAPVADVLLDSGSGYEAKTVYIDATWGSRTDGSAEVLSKSHKKYASMGYRLMDIELYLENSDLRGFFVTYEREAQKSD